MKIQCKLGPAQPVVGGHTYDFTLDEHGRYVAEVPNIVHQMVMLSVEHYIVAPDITPEAKDDSIELSPSTSTVFVELTPGLPPATLDPAAPEAPRGRRGKRRN